MMYAIRSHTSVNGSSRLLRRALSTLQSNPHIYVFPTSKGPRGSSILSFLQSSPPNANLAIGWTTKLPPTPDSTIENPHFLQVLQSVIAKHATEDPAVKSQALAYASQAGAGLGSGGAFFGGKSRTPRRAVGGGGGAGGGGAGGASAQGGMGGAGVGGWVHISDQRNPPDWGRVAYPEDIFGTVQVDGHGDFVGDNGNYQESGTYRMVTNEGILNLSPFLREKLVERLRELEKTL